MRGSEKLESKLLLGSIVSLVSGEPGLVPVKEL